MIIKALDVNNRKEALELVLSVFMQFEAPDYSNQGIKTFVDFIHNQEEIDKLDFFGAFKDDEIVGVVATRNNGNHIALLFVDGKHHREGIGRKLFETISQKSLEGRITVNSSPYAVEFYKKMGFIPNSEEQITDGIRYTPMTFVKEKN